MHFYTCDIVKLSLKLALAAQLVRTKQDMEIAKLKPQLQIIHKSKGESK